MTTTETKFMQCAEEYLHLAMIERGLGSLEEMAAMVAQNTKPAHPVIVSDYMDFTDSELEAISRDYRMRGLVNVILANPPSERLESEHPLFTIARQLEASLHLHYPLRHPLEGHPEATSRFGPNDNTVKIYNLPKPVDGPSYREVAETSDAFEVHLDGLGSAGTVQTVILYMDSAPLFGGYTFFYDIPAIAAALFIEDPDACRHLFLPDAFTAIRPRGKGAIKVTTPVLYLNEQNQPHVFYRKNSGEYRMTWRADLAPLARAASYLDRFTAAYSPGSTFVPFTRPGCLCLSRNRDIAHGRTAFIDGQLPSQRRLLSRKWFMTTQGHSIYKHVPGILVRTDLASLIPAQFGPDVLDGEWLYDQFTDTNNRTR